MISLEMPRPRRVFLLFLFFGILEIARKRVLKRSEPVEVARETQDMIDAGLYGINDISLEEPVPVLPEVPQSVPCGQTLKLESLDLLSSIPYSVIMVETSGRPRLSPRQACAAESAARRSGLQVTLVMVSSQLDLADNTTCHLVNSDISHKIKIFTVDMENISRETPMEGFFSREDLLTSPYRYSHVSDGLRWLLIYKYGGFYLDLDFLVLNDLTHYSSFVLEEETCHWYPAFLSGWVRYSVMEFLTIKRSDSILAAGAVAFPAEHPLMRLMVEKVPQTYRGEDWITIGPGLLTSCVKEFAKVEDVLKIPVSTGIHVIRQKHILGVPVFSVRDSLFQWKSLDQWRDSLASSSSLHFGSSLTSDLAVDKADPLSSAYSLLAPHYCPVAFHSRQEFTSEHILSGSVK